MANEIRVKASLQFSKDGSTDSFTISDDVTMAGAQYVKKTQSIGFAAEENLDKGDISTIGYLLVKNLDTTNFVTLASLTATFSIKLGPGECALVRWVGAQVIAQADTGACIVEYLMIEA